MFVHYLPQDPDNTAIRELRDELKDLNQTIKKANRISERFMVLLIIIAFIQLIVSAFQFIVAANLRVWWGLILEGIIIIAIIWGTISFFKKEK